jgi:hypothetical protein
MKKVIRPEDDSTKRIIRSELFSMIDKKIMQMPIAVDAIKRKDFNALVYWAASTCVGWREKTGKNDGYEIGLVQDTIGTPDKWPYCMSGVQSWVSYVETKMGAKSKLFVSEHCATVWVYTPKELRVKQSDVRMGDIPIWKDYGKQSGHTEVAGSPISKGYFDTVGANTSGYFTKTAVQFSKEVEREGNAIVFARRSISPTKSRELLGFLRAF